ncbi:MAG: hypothetical protein AB7R55_12500 [Gemmatimonadales bacterium]
MTTVRRRVYGFDAARWLTLHVPGVEIDWKALGDRADEIFPPLLPRFLSGAESDAIDSNELTSREVIDAARGERPALVWLLAGMARALPPAPRARLWALLELPLHVARLETPPAPRRSAGAGATPRPAGRETLGVLRRAVADAPAALLAALGSRDGDVFEARPVPAAQMLVCLPRSMPSAGIAQAWASAVWDDREGLVAVAVGELLPHRIDLRFERRPADDAPPRALLGLHQQVLRAWCPAAAIVARGRSLAGAGWPSPAAIGAAVLTGSLSPALARRLETLARRAPGASGADHVRRLVRAAPLFQALRRELERSPFAARRTSR